MSSRKKPDPICDLLDVLADECEADGAELSILPAWVLNSASRRGAEELAARLVAEAVEQCDTGATCCAATIPTGAVTVVRDVLGLQGYIVRVEEVGTHGTRILVDWELTPAPVLPH